MKEIRRILQNPMSDDCVACVAAMATQTSVETFKKIMRQPEGPYSDWQFNAYCMLYGFVVGSGFRWDKSPFDPAKEMIGAEVDLMNFPAYIVVDSETRSGVEHAIYWNSKEVFDPNPDADSQRPLSSYKIISVFPINHLDQDGNITYSIMRRIISKRISK